MDRPWLSSYEAGIPHDIDPNQYRSLISILDESVKRFPTNPAFSNFGTSLNYLELDKASRKIAAYLQSLDGLEKGDRVAIMLPNILQYPVVLFGVLRAGFCVVNVDPMYTARELTFQLCDSGVKALVFLENFADTVEKVLPNTDVRHMVSTQVGDMLGFPKSLLINSVIKHVKKMIPNHHLNGLIQFNDALKKGEKLTLRPLEISHEDIAFLQYTGGTTGVSKGAILTHRNVLSNVLQSRAWAKERLAAENEKVINALPLYHIFSLTANCLFFMSIGGENVLITNPRDFKDFIKKIKNEQFSAITGVNTLFRKLLDTKGFDDIDFSKLKVTFTAGMAATQDVAAEWKQRTNSTIIEAYGLSETSPAACINPMNLSEFSGNVGLPISSTWIRIADENGADIGFNKAGEVCVKGPQVTQGYWQLPHLNKSSFTSDGYFKTGDIAKMDERGFVTLLDRKKDIILVSGFNVYPNEIEGVVSNHPNIVEVAAIGIPDKITGETVKLFAVKNVESLTQEQLIEYCREYLTGYKRPTIVEFVDELPKSNVGKIIRKKLRNIV